MSVAADDVDDGFPALALSSPSRWRRLRGYQQLGEVIENVKFVKGIREDGVAA